MNTNLKRTAVVAGSTGLIGKEVVKLLIDDPNYEKVICLVRKKTNQSNPKVVELEINFDEIPSCLSLIKSADDIYCCLGTTIKTVGGSKPAFYKVDHDYPVDLAKWGESIGAKRYLVVSAIGANSKSSIFYNTVKGDMENDILKLNIPSINIFRPSILIGDRKENRTGEKIGIVFFKALAFLFVGPLKNYKAIHVKKVAEAMVQKANSAKVGKVVVLSGEIGE